MQSHVFSQLILNPIQWCNGETKVWLLHGHITHVSRTFKVSVNKLYLIPHRTHKTFAINDKCLSYNTKYNISRIYITMAEEGSQPLLYNPSAVY